MSIKSIIIIYALDLKCHYALPMIILTIGLTGNICAWIILKDKSLKK